MHDFDDEAGVRQPLNSGRSNIARSIKNATKETRLAFVRKVYGILCAQILVTVTIAAYIVGSSGNREWLRSNEWLLWLSVIGTTSTVCIMSCCESVVRSFPLNYVFLFTFTVFEAIMIGFVSSVFTWQSLMLSVIVTGAIFFCLTLWAFNTTRDFTGYGPYLFVALCALVIFGLVLSIMPLLGISMQIGTILYDVLIVILFSCYIVLDTQMMLGDYGGHQVQFGIDDYVFAALHLYLDLVNLFVALLSLMGKRDNDI